MSFFPPPNCLKSNPSHSFCIVKTFAMNLDPFEKWQADLYDSVKRSGPKGKSGLGFSGSEKEDKEKQSGAKEQQQPTSASEGPPKRTFISFQKASQPVTETNIEERRGRPWEAQTKSQMREKEQLHPSKNTTSTETKDKEKDEIPKRDSKEVLSSQSIESEQHQQSHKRKRDDTEPEPTVHNLNGTKTTKRQSKFESSERTSQTPDKKSKTEEKQLTSLPSEPTKEETLSKSNEDIPSSEESEPTDEESEESNYSE